MRIVAGEHKGRVINSPSEQTTRPTTDRVRESMFSSIFSRLGSFDGVKVLDAFAGSGALGLEALSRGADSCLFYEQDRDAAKVLQSNIDSFGLPARKARICTADVLVSAKHPLSFGSSFGLVLLDPPYALEPSLVASFLGQLAHNGDLSSGAIIAYEHSQAKKEAVASVFLEPGCLFMLDNQKKYGKIGVTYLEYQG